MNKRTCVLLGIFFIVLLGSFYVKNHEGDVFTFIAQRCFRQNDMLKAQFYYEKAFDTGVVDSRHRNIYVNSIINSPLTTDAQEKLVKFLDYPVDDAAKQKAKNFLDDLKKEILLKYPENYISHTPLNQQVIRWNELPITYGFVNVDSAPSYFTKEITNAFTEWEIESNNKLMFLRDDNDPNIVIRYMEENPANAKDKRYVVAYTVPTINGRRLINMTINFYMFDPMKKYYSKNQVYNTALHEIAHSLGFMGHCDDEDNIMYLTNDSMSVANDLRDGLNHADVNTISLLYDIKPDITNTFLKDSKYIPYLVLGDDSSISKVKMREAINYVKKAPSLPSGYIDLAEGYVSSKNYVKAIKVLDKALRVADTDEIRSIIYYNLSICYFMIENTPTARSYLEKSIKINDSIEKHRLLAEIFLKEGKKTDAISIYEQLISKDQKNIEYVIALTNIYVEGKEYRRARGVLKDFIKKNPSEKNNPRLKSYGVLMKFL